MKRFVSIVAVLLIVGVILLAAETPQLEQYDWPDVNGGSSGGPACGGQLVKVCNLTCWTVFGYEICFTGSCWWECR